jgi:hypothetical protein
MQEFFMSMHLEGPWLSTTGKRKGKQKFRNADEAKKARQLADDWQKLLKKYDVKQVERKPTQTTKINSYAKSLDPYRRDTGPRIPSLNPTDMSPCTKKQQQQYTGTMIKGIGTMHKSNAVPIFSDEQAQDIAKMRR